MNSNGIIAYLEQLLGEGTMRSTSKGIQYSWKCPLCNDHKERFFVHPSKQVYYCHNCTSSNSLITLISEINHTTWKTALGIYRNYVDYSQQLPEDIEQEIYSKLTSVSEIEVTKYIYPLPDEFIPIKEAYGNAGESAKGYIRSRGISINLASEYGIGYCEEGKYHNRIILPNYENGELIYWQSRTWEDPPTIPVLKKLFRKVMNPSLTEEQKNQGILAIDKSEVVGNIDRVISSGMAIVTEGYFDMVTLRDVGCCTHGKVMSDTQFMKLVTNKDKIDTVMVMYDSDALKYTLSTAKRLNKYFDNVFIGLLPEGEDPNSLGYKRCIEIIDQAVRYTPMTETILKLKGSIR